LDFYHREYLYFGYGKTENETYWNPSLNDGIALVDKSKTFGERIMNKLRLGWIKKQQYHTTRTDVQRALMRKYLLTANENQKDIFMNMYKRNNLPLLPFWRLIGVNAHTVCIIAFMFLGRFDIYLIAFDIVIFNIIILIVGYFQNKADTAFMRQLERTYKG
jgi:hypothetical protein